MISYAFKGQKIVPTKRKGLWTHYSQPSEEESEFLIEKYNLSEDFIEGIADEHEIPQLEVGKHYTKILIQIPTIINNQLRTFPFAFIYEKKRLITICERKNDYLDKLFAIKFEEKTIQQLIIDLLFIIEEEYDRNSNIIAKRIRQKKLNISTLNNKDIVDLVELEDTLNNTITSVAPNITIYTRILQKRLLDLQTEDYDEFVDILNSAKQTVEQTKLAIKTVQNIRNAYSTIMTNNLNTVMKVLTATTIIIALPTLISSIYGMNVDLPLQGHPYAFLLVICIAILLSMCTFLIFRIKRWL